jgi:hypothetical protein
MEYDILLHEADFLCARGQAVTSTLVFEPFNRVW